MALLPSPLSPAAEAAAIADVLYELADARDRVEQEGLDVGTVPSRLVHVAHLPARAARYRELARPLHQRVAARLLEPLCSPPTRGIDLARPGRPALGDPAHPPGRPACTQGQLA